MNLTIAFEAHIQSVVRYADALVQDIREDVVEDPNDFEEVVREELQVYGNMIAQVAVINAAGRLVYSSLGPVTGNVDLSGREHFQVHLENPSQDKLFISKPVLGRVSGIWSIQFTRPIVDEGKFVGVFVISIPINFFTDFYRKINVGPSGLIALVGKDRIPRAVASKSGLNTTLDGIVLSQDEPYFDNTNPAEGLYRGASAFDRVDSLVAYRRLEHTGLIVLVQLSPTDYLSSFNERRQFLLFSATVTSALLFAFAIFLYFVTRQHLGNTAALKQSYSALRQLVSVDLLTGARSRGDFLEALETEFSRAERHGTELSLIWLDLDHFKRVNDTYGHPVGDTVLSQVTTLCNGVLRAHDVFGRLGGEEFGVILPHTNGMDALDVAEKLRKIVEKAVIPTDRGPLQVSISCGVSSMLPVGDSPSQLIVRADDALYKAKHAGRNRVCAAYAGETMRSSNKPVDSKT
ncbi:diguanylate cyclase [Pseudomonas hefeiensis]|nr:MULTISPECIES: diguanylate cyclase [unclassified Pseudomonas]WLH97773.1 diguanylate cyclase [Pseudomonas sp. FP53]WLI42045.1 diguanylate cyclase [Pseudomonas sp. FP821]